MSSSGQSSPNDATSHRGAADLLGELEARSAELDHMFRTAAHDLRAPLRSIEAFTRIATETDNRAEAAEHLERVLAAVGRMRNLLDSLLDYADAGGQALALATARLNDVVQAALADLSIDVAESQAVIHVGPLPTVECDPTQLRRVFVNLLANSIKHAGEPGRTIVVRADDQPQRVVVAISDDGDGFATDLTEEAFEPFRRLTSTTAGQGIGLAICRRIVERHGGEIWAESNPGVGTTISFTLAKAGG